MFSRKVLHVPNFCPECGSSEATSRFCSSCGYSLTSTPAPPDARTRVEETPVFRPFAPPAVETWDSLAADPWSSAGVVTPPPVRNVVTQTPVAVSETKLAAVKWLWRVNLLGLTALVWLASFLSTSTPGALLSLVMFGALLTMTGVAASAARQVGAKTPHPAIAVLLVIGAAVAAYFLAGLISPDYNANTDPADIKVGNAQGQYMLALLITNLAIYLTALAPAVAISKSLENRCPGEWFRFGKAKGPFGWRIVLVSALVISFFEIVGPVMFDGSYTMGKWMMWAAPLFLWGILDFEKRDLEAERAAEAEQWLKRKPEPRGFWRVFRWWCFFIIGSFVGLVLLLLLIAFLVSVFG